jgi:hypothetical protein
MRVLRAREGMRTRALEFAILTGAPAKSAAWSGQKSTSMGRCGPSRPST